MAKALEGVVLSDRIRLDKWDPDGDSYVVFQRPSRWESEQLAAMQAQSELVFDTEQRGEVRQRDRTALAVLESRMVAMTLVECNIPSADTGDLVFIPGQSCRAPRKKLTDRVEKGFYEAWYALPDELSEEIIDKLRDWHPPFNWRSDRGED